MAKSVQRSLRHEYELYVENEIETYKESLRRSSLLKIGDEAVASLRSQAQLELTELVVWEEVDRIIRKRLRIPAYSTWRRKRIKIMQEYQRPEYWGLAPDSVLAREVRPVAESHVLVAGEVTEGAALYLAAHGCEVFAIDQAQDSVQRVVNAAQAAGLTDRVHGYIADLRQWSPDVQLNAVVCAPSAFNGLSKRERKAVIQSLQQATYDGGIHVVDTDSLVPAGSLETDQGNERQQQMDEELMQELSAQYAGWKVSIAQSGFFARKGAA